MPSKNQCFVKKAFCRKSIYRSELNKQRFRRLIDLIGTIGFNQDGHKAKDLLGRVYEYFLGQFADAEGKKEDSSGLPVSIVKLLVEMLEPYNGRVI